MDGLLMLHKLEDIMDKKDSGLYRDDVLLVVEGGGQKSDRIKKKLCKLYKEEGPEIIAESVQFLDVNLDLSDGTFKPFCNPNSQLKYVCKESNQPPMIVKNIPEGVNRRL